MTTETIGAVASVATALGVLVAIGQLWYARKLAVTQFEDQLADQYRQLIHRIPVDALLGRELGAEQHAASLGAFLHYFDLSNDQAFLHRQGRVTKEAWRQWEDGILDHLRRPAFQRAWSEIGAAMPESFEDLRLVLATQSRPVPAGEISAGAAQRRSHAPALSGDTTRHPYGDGTAL